MAPPRDEPRLGAGEGGDGGGEVDVGALAAKLHDLDVRQRRTEERQRQLLQRLSRIAGFASAEFEGLQAD